MNKKAVIFFLACVLIVSSFIQVEFYNHVLRRQKLKSFSLDTNDGSYQNKVTYEY